MPKASKMPSIPNPNFQLHVGWRTIKTAVTAMLVAVIYCLIDRNPAFACIGVIFGLGYDMEDSIKNGGNRLFGTLIGGLLAIVVFWLYLLFFPQGGHTVFLALLLGVGVVILILLCNYFWPGGVQPGGVVLCIVLFSTPVETYISYSLNRIFDTAVGVIVALAVSTTTCPGKKSCPCGRGSKPEFPVRAQNNPFYCLPSCQNATALAAATLSESTPWDMGILTV